MLIFCLISVQDNDIAINKRGFINAINDVNVYVGWVREHKEANQRYGNCQPNRCYMKFVYEAPMIFNSSGFN